MANALNFLAKIEHKCILFKWLKSLCGVFATLFTLLMVSMAATHDTVVCVKLFIEVINVCIPLFICLMLVEIVIPGLKIYAEMNIELKKIEGVTQRNFNDTQVSIEQAKRKTN